MRLQLPRGVTIRDHGTRAAGLNADNFPDCWYGCSLWVRVIPDTARAGVEAYLSLLAQSEVRVDSVNKDPRTTVFEFNSYHFPAQPFPMTNERAFWLAGDCGDCLSGSVFVARNGQIVEVGYAVDSREPNSWKRECQLKNTIASLEWSR